ncbi:hypothetical protein ABZP36_006601 [Zizania latifolia]
MSRRSSKVAAAATSRRTRRAEQQQQPTLSLAFVSSNPIFLCEDGSGDLPRPRYGPGSLHALVRGDVPAGAEDDDGGKRLLPLPLPPSRAHREGRGGTGLPAWHVGPTIVVGPHGRVLRMVAPAQQPDPFLAAYVACTKGKSAAPARKQQQPQPKRKTTMKKKRGEAAGMRGGCGIWNGWAVGARYAGMISCRHVGAVTVLHGAAPPPAVDAPAGSPAHPRLDLSRPPVVLPGRRRALH